MTERVYSLAGSLMRSLTIAGASLFAASTSSTPDQPSMTCEPCTGPAENSVATWSSIDEKS